MPSFINKQTTLDLNGPVLSFVQQPESVQVCTSGIATFVGLATATFPTQDPVNPATNTGYISYNWYLNDEALSDGDLNGTTVTGAATTTLTLSGISSAVLFNNSRVVLRADYIPSAYSQPDGSDVNAGTARSTGNAINDPKDSEAAILGVYPDVVIVRQPGIAASTITASQYPIFTITDDLGGSSTVDLTQISTDLSRITTYSDFITGREYTITANRSVKTRIYAVGAGGGTSDSRSVLGGTGGAAQGVFTFIANQTYKLIVGGAGQNGSGGHKGGYGFGGNGGKNSSSSFWTGAGGGGLTGLFVSSITQDNSILIAGGGGGGSDDPAGGGGGGGEVGGNSGNAPDRGGKGGTQNNGGDAATIGGIATPGTALRGGDGHNGGSGGGAGYFGGGGGSDYGPGGGGGGSGYLSSLLITEGSYSSSGSAGGGSHAQNGSFKIEFIETIASSIADTTVAQGSAAVFTVEASTTDASQGDISYQWQLNGVDLEDAEDFTSVPTSARITITDGSGTSSTIDLQSLSTYSSFTAGQIYTLVSDINIEVKGYAVGGGGGTSTYYRSVAGGPGGASQGKFTLFANKTYKLVVGSGGDQSGYNVSGGGGGSGGGNGGGYTAIFEESISQSNAILVAGGGGGGANDPAGGGAGGGTNGGNSGNVGGRGGYGATQNSGGSGGSGGNKGGALQGGPGAGGGGGGYFGGGGGTPYNGCCADGAGGGGSGYIHPTLVKDGSFSSSGSAGGGSAGQNGSFKLEWVSSAVVYNTFVSGSKTDTLAISLPNVSSNLVRVAASHPLACNSPVYSDSVQFDVVAPTNRALVSFEGYTANSTTAILQEFDLTNEDYVLDSSVIDSDTICFFAKERDISIEMELYAAKGADYGSNFGGEGGYSKIRFTMKKNEEYILKGIQSKTALYLYRKAQLIACVGQGGSAGSDGNGGRGGGINVAGENGFGRFSGTGGEIIQIGQMSGNGIFGSSSGATLIYSEDSKSTGIDGGRTISCPKGVYWRDQGKSACSDLGTIKFRLSDGTEVSNSSSIIRGFKDGYGINQTAGSSNDSESGKGGNGATGGSGGSSGGGGGGSGYTDGSITVVDTTLGGNNSLITKMVIRSFEEAVGDFYEDSSGRILILSCATAGKDPRTLTKTTGKVFPGSDTCLDDERWQSFLELALTQDYRLAVTLDGTTSALLPVTTNNLRKMVNANPLPIVNSLTDWQEIDQDSYSDYIFLVWDEPTPRDTSGILWALSSSSVPGFGYYGVSGLLFQSNSNGNQTANWWILPPGVPDFS